ncbi:MAG: DUF3788 family protein [Calditrichaceae bacterium]
METKEDLELRDETVYPDEQVLKAALGTSYAAYCELLKLYDDNGMVYEWRYYKDGKAWLCKVQKKKRTIVWMSAWKGYLKTVMYFGEKYIEQLYNLDISAEMKDQIRNTKNVGKLKPCIFEIRDKDVPPEFDTVMQFKIIAK